MWCFRTKNYHHSFNHKHALKNRYSDKTSVHPSTQTDIFTYKHTVIKPQFIHPHIHLQAYKDKTSFHPSTHTYKHTVIKQFINPCTHTHVHLQAYSDKTVHQSMHTHTHVHLQVCSDKTSVHPSTHSHTLTYKHTAVRL